MPLLAQQSLSVPVLDGNSIEAVHFISAHLRPELLASDAADQVLLMLQNLAVQVHGARR